MKPFTDDDLQEMKWGPCEFKCGRDITAWIERKAKGEGA